MWVHRWTRPREMIYLWTNDENSNLVDVSSYDKILTRNSNHVANNFCGIEWKQKPLIRRFLWEPVNVCIRAWWQGLYFLFMID